MQQRPKGVTTLSLLAVVGGLFSFVAGVALMLGGGLETVFGAPGGNVMVLGAVMFALGFASLVLGYGFWMQKRWAWASGFVVYAVSLVTNVSSLALGASLVSVALPVAVAVAVMWYLVQPSTRAALGR